MEKDEPMEVLSLNSSSSLRRKSFQVHNELSLNLPENNDEAEKLARRLEINASITSIENINTSNKRKSLGLGFIAQMSSVQVKNHISECIKLSTENKINIKNAFSLEMINFMSYMIKKEDDNMSNLQTASTSLDVSTKIYGFRVDGIHTEIMKMLGASDKQDNPIDNINEYLSNEQENQINNFQRQKKRTKKKNRQIFSTADSLKGTVEIMKPSLWMMEDKDLQTTDGLYQVILSNHANSKYYLHLYNDIIVDIVKHKTSSENTKIAISKIEDFSKLEICPPLNNFKFQNDFYDNDKEEENEENENENTNEINENQFQFNLNATVQSDNEIIHDNINYLDIQDGMENTNICIEIQKPVEKIVDLCKVLSNISTNKTSEYSFLQKSSNLHWAGPSHWRMSNFIKYSKEGKIIAACAQEPVKKRKEIEICYDDNIKKAVIPKFVISKAIKFDSNKLDWSEGRLTLPRDMHYNIANAVKLYLHKLIHVNIRNKDDLNVTHISDIENYNYDNENDMSNYCPYVLKNDYEINEDNNKNEHNHEIENDEIETQMTFAGDNLVAAPKLTNKISIAYSIYAKRIDMRQLKKSIWKSLTVTNNKENRKNQEEDKIEGNKSFSEIYKTLPNILTKTNIEALSFPISFVSLLHLANEKTLKIQSLPDMSDLLIETN